MPIFRLHRPLPLHSVVARMFVVDSPYFNPKETAIVINDTTNPLMKVIEIYQAFLDSNYIIPIGYISTQSVMEFIDSGRMSFGDTIQISFPWNIGTEEEDMRTMYYISSNNIPLSIKSICAYRLRNEHYTSEVMFGKVDDRYYVLSTDEHGHTISISLGVLEGLEEVLIQFREENGLNSEPTCRRFRGLYEREVAVEIEPDTAPTYYSDTTSTATWYRL